MLDLEKARAVCVLSQAFNAIGKVIWRLRCLGSLKIITWPMAGFRSSNSHRNH